MLQEEMENINNIWKIQNETLIDYRGEETNLIIPWGIKEIESQALSTKELRSISIPDSVMFIKKMAFSHNHLTKVEIPSSVRQIGSMAFWGNNIKKLTINGDIRIEVGAFEENPLEIVRISKNVQDIECQDDTMNTVKTLEIPNYDRLSIFCNKCVNIEELYIDNLPNLSLFKFLDKCQLRKKENLKKIFIKNEVRGIDRTALKIYYPNIVFGYDSPTVLFSSETTSSVSKSEKCPEDLEVQERVNKIYQTISLLDEKEKSMIEKEVALLIEEYKMDIKELKPKFEIKNEISMTFQPTRPMDVQTLRKNLLHNLDTMIVNLIASSNLNKLIKEIAEYKGFMQIKLIKTPTEVVTTKDKVQFIVFVYQNLENDSIKKELNELLNYFQKRVSEEIVQMFQNRINLSEKLDVTMEFERKITELYEKTKNYQTKVSAYQELLDSLELKNDSELAIEIRTSKEILNIFCISDKNKISEDLENVITKYKKKISENASFEKIQNLEDVKQMEWSIRSDLQPILVEIYNLSPKAVCFHKLKEELNSSLKYFFGTGEKEASTKGAIFDIVNEIKSIINQESLCAEIRSKVQNLVENCLQGWLKELTANEYKILETTPIKEVGINLSDNLHFEILVLKDLLSIKTSLQSYIKKNTEYQETSNGIFNLNSNFSFEDLSEEYDFPLINVEGLPAEEFNLENYKNYMKNQYKSSYDPCFTKDQWDREVEKLGNEFLNKIIQDTKEFILCQLRRKQAMYGKKIQANFFGNFNAVKFDKCIQLPPQFNKEKDLIISVHLVETFFQVDKIMSDILPMEYVFYVQKEVWDILYENNCSQQAIRRRIKEIRGLEKKSN